MKRSCLTRFLAAFAIVLITARIASAKTEPNAQTIVGTVTRVCDGDTIWVCDGIARRKIRLDRIDAPESSQPFGNESATHLKSLIDGKDVRVEYKSTDRYGRILGIVLLGETDINLLMVREGFAWHYRHFDKTPSYSAAESEARAAKRGIWAETAPVTPHEWRKRKRERPSRQEPRRPQCAASP